MYELISEINFNEYRSEFQRNMAAAVREINNSKQIFLLADKTSNIYKVSVEQYEKLLLENVTKDYKQIPVAKLN